MKDKAIRLLIAGTFKTGLQAADWLAGTGEVPTLPASGAAFPLAEDL